MDEEESPDAYNNEDEDDSSENEDEAGFMEEKEGVAFNDGENSTSELSELDRELEAEIMGEEESGNSLKDLFNETPQNIHQQQQPPTNRLGSLLNGQSQEAFSVGGYSDSSESEEIVKTKSKKKNSKKIRHKMRKNIPDGMRPDNSLESAILSRLPDDYSGPLPDIYQNSLPDVNGFNMMGNSYGMGMGMGMQNYSSGYSGMQPMDMGFGPSNPGYNFGGLQGYDLNGLPTGNSMPNIQLPSGYDGNTMGLPLGPISQPMMGGGEKKKKYFLKKVEEAK